jgi:hypothetical protein
MHRAWVFVMVIEHSRHMFAKIVFDQETETWLELHLDAFRAFGGVPRVIVPDNRVRADDRAGRAQLIRYVARPPFAEAQLEVIDDEQVRLELRSPSRSGQRELVLHPLVLLRRLAWLVPPPRQHQVRAFGVLAPAARLRSKVVPVGRVVVQGRWFGAQKFEPAERVPYREAWAKLVARVYDVDGHACPRCPGRLRPFGAVLPPTAAEWVRRSQSVPLESTGPPSRQERRRPCGA